MRPFPTRHLLLTAACLALLPASAAAQDAQVDIINTRFAGKIVCRAGQKKAEFKSYAGDQVLLFGPNQLAKFIDQMTYPEPGASATYEQRETKKAELVRAQHMLKRAPCLAPGVAPDGTAGTSGSTGTTGSGDDSLALPPP